MSTPPRKVTIKSGSKWGRTDRYAAVATAGSTVTEQLGETTSGSVDGGIILPSANASILVSWDQASRIRNYDARWTEFHRHGNQLQPVIFDTRDVTGGVRRVTSNLNGKLSAVVMYAPTYQGVGLYEAQTTIVAEIDATGDAELDQTPLPAQPIHGSLYVSGRP